MAKKIKIDTDAYAALLEEAVRLQTLLVEKVNQVNEGTDPVRQDVLAAAYGVYRASKILEKAVGTFAEFAKNARLNKRAFEDGAFAVTFKVTTRRTPQWKAEAIKQANALADEQGRAFAESVYVDGVLSVTPPTESVSVALNLNGEDA